MFAFGRETPALQLYGKLPLAKDYLRVGCGEGAGRDLREWLDHGFGAARDPSEQPVLGEPLRYLGQSSGEPQQGTVWPSSDTGGLRLFPFTLFVARRRKALLTDLSESLARAEGLWRHLDILHAQCISASDGQELLATLRGHELDLSALDAVEGESAHLDAWVAGLWPDDGLDGLFLVLDRIVALAKERHSGPFRMPIVRQLPLRDQVLGWVSLLRALGALPEDEVPTLFFPKRLFLSGPSVDVAFVVAASRPLGESEVQWIVPPRSALELGAGDFCHGLEPADVDPSSVPEAAVPLHDSLRSALASFRARSGG